MLSLKRLGGANGVLQFRRFASKVLESTKAAAAKEETASAPPIWKAQRGGIVEPETEKGEVPASFVGEFFLGKFDAGVLTYPEVLDKQRHDWLHKTLAPVQTFFDEKVNSKAIDAEANIPEDILKGLKSFGLFGQEVPVDLGGLQLNTTEHARFTEAIGADTAIGLTLTAHQSFGVKSLLLFGSESQKQKYLPKLASGELLVAFCLTEPSNGSDMASMKTTAALSTDAKSWKISGTKSMITNGDTADLFLVFARTADNTVSPTSTKRITAFIVEREFGGITNGEVKDMLGARGARVCDVIFDQTIVPMENVLGEIGDGFKVAAHILNYGRLSSSCLASGLLKKMINAATQQTIKREQFGKSLCEFQLIQEKLARMTMSAYVIESVIYMTAGLIDANVYKDTSIETAILKVISSEGVWQGANECLQLFGGQGYMSDSLCQLHLRDARLFLIAEQTNEILRLFISTMGVHHSGQTLRDYVKQVRNPLQFPVLALRKTIERIRHTKTGLKLTLRLREYLHPTLVRAADTLEGSLQRLKIVVELVLERHGAEVMNAQLELNRLADIVIDMYAMTAVLSRASRSYCIGLRNAETEIAIAQLFCTEADNRITIKAQQIEDGIYIVPDNPLMLIADTVLTDKGYFAEHPLQRNFW